MVFSTLEKTLAAAVGLDIVKPGTSRKAATAAAKAVLGVAGRGAAAAAPRVGALAANPLVAGTALGLGVLATPPGQDLLEAAAARGQSDRVRLQQAIDQYIFEQTVLPFRQQQAEPVVTSSGIQVSDFGKGGRTSRGGAPNTYQKAVKARRN